MLRWAVIFVVIAIIAAVFAFSGIEEQAATISRTVLLLSLVLFLIAMIGGYAPLRKK